jgi:hypothetical protein
MWKSGNEQRRRTIGAGIIFGIAIGAALGIVLGQLVLGMGVGFALGAAAALAVSSRRPDGAGKSTPRSPSDSGGGWA